MESYPAPDVESGPIGDAGPFSAALNSVEFAYLARTLCAAADELGVGAPSFRSPPSAGGAGRSIRRSPGQRATVAVRYRGRPRVSVAADMVEGILQAANQSSSGLRRPDFTTRDQLWRAGLVALSELTHSGDLASGQGLADGHRQAA